MIMQNQIVMEVRGWQRDKICGVGSRERSEYRKRRGERPCACSCAGRVEKHERREIESRSAEEDASRVGRNSQFTPLDE